METIPRKKQYPSLFTDYNDIKQGNTSLRQNSKPFQPPSSSIAQNNTFTYPYLNQGYQNQNNILRSWFPSSSIAQNNTFTYPNSNQHQQNSFQNQNDIVMSRLLSAINAQNNTFTYPYLHQGHQNAFLNQNDIVMSRLLSAINAQNNTFTYPYLHQGHQNAFLNQNDMPIQSNNNIFKEDTYSNLIDPFELSEKAKDSKVENQNKEPDNIGLSQKSKDIKKIPSKISKDRSRKYHIGQHGFKKREQQRLRKMGFQVSGKSHESEHVIGYNVLAREADLKRNSNSEARELENKAFAYQEVYEHHRDHIGTGNKLNLPDNKQIGPGMNSEEYRLAQLGLLKDNDVSSAVQLNQLGYAFVEGFQNNESQEAKAADISYNDMIKNMYGVRFKEKVSGNIQNKIAEVDPKTKAEMFLARHTARTGKWPSIELENEVKKYFGVK